MRKIITLLRLFLSILGLTSTGCSFSGSFDQGGTHVGLKLDGKSAEVEVQRNATSVTAAVASNETSGQEVH